MNLDLVINGVAFHLGDREDRDRLTGARLRRLNLWQRLVRREKRGCATYVTLNCRLQCFGDSFDLHPSVETYLTRDRRWRTEVEVTYDQKRLVAVRFRVMEGRYAAPNYLCRFNDLCTERFGEPGHNGGKWLKWQDSKHLVVCAFEPEGPHAEFRWSLKENGRLRARVCSPQ